MKWIGFSVVFIVVFVGTVLARIPLGAVIDRPVIHTLELSWVTVEGTIWKGSIQGLRFEDQPIGNIALSMTPTALLGGKLGYNIDMIGPAGRGAGDLSIGRKSLLLKDFSGSVYLEQLVRLAGDIREIGGAVEANVNQLYFEDAACITAKGTIRTDALMRAGQAYGRSFGSMEGRLVCDGDMVLLPMAALSPEGDQISLDVRVGLAEALSADARVRTSDPEFAVALGLLGFRETDGTYVYYRELDPIGG